MDGMDPRLKAAAAWSGVGVSKFLESIGISSWGDFAAMCAAFYSLLLIGEYLWKKWKSRSRK
jgi:hypothetical protein